MHRFWLVSILTLLSSALQAEPFAPAFSLDDLDLGHCQSWQHDRSEKASPEVLGHILGLAHQNERDLQRWIGPTDRDEKSWQYGAPPAGNTSFAWAYQAQ